jgi:hypothetical protein
MNRNQTRDRSTDTNPIVAPEAIFRSALQSQSGFTPHDFHQMTSTTLDVVIDESTVMSIA